MNTEILLPRGDRMARNQVEHQKQDANGNPCLYEVEFPGGEITELAANIIAELMYAQCDIDRNE